jgi:hypothetical protein
MATFAGTALTCLACLAVLGASAAASAQPAAPVVSVEQREKDTNAALLKTLVERRALVAASSASNKQAALDFMDSRIAEIKKRLK